MSITLKARAAAAAVAVSTAAVTVVTTGGTAPATPATPATPAGPATFADAVFAGAKANPYFPLNVGHTTILKGADDGERFREVVTVTSRTKTILGVEATVVDDVLRRPDGILAEKTRDWYAADDQGNVWYLGEDTATYDETGRLESREGSWQAGVRGAEPGLVMPADPVPTDAFRQEFRENHAEDQAWVVQHKKFARTPAGRHADVIRTFEWTRLEPGVMSTKYYAAGIGIVSERDLTGGNEHFWVVAHHE